MLANMACSLIEHKRINTTTAKAKALKQFVEPLITKSKAENNKTAEQGTHNRRVVFSSLRSKHAVTELFSTVAEKVGDRPGGYTRIIKLGNRLGDNADMAMIELVDFNEIYNAGKPKKKTTRRSRRSKSKQEEEQVATAKVEQAETEVKTETAEAKAETPETEAKAEAPEKKKETKAEAPEEKKETKAEAPKEDAPAEGDSAAEEGKEKKDDADA